MRKQSDEQFSQTMGEELEWALIMCKKIDKGIEISKEELEGLAMVVLDINECMVSDRVLPYPWSRYFVRRTR